MITDWSKVSLYIGVGLIGVGFALIFLAWNGASGLDYTQGQIPYLISGGIGGLGMVFVGAMMLVLQNARRDRAILSRQLSELSASLDRLSRASSAPADGRVSTADGLVVAGATSYHKLECRLVRGRTEAERLSIQEAEERGLDACRICRP